MGRRGQNRRDRLRTVWTPEMDRYFLDLMLEEVRKGNRIDDHLFSRTAWIHMNSLFSAKFKNQYDNDILKNRHKTLRNLYRFVRNLLEQRGFSWDDKRQMVTADNCVWDKYIKVHPEARSYRIKTIPYFCDLRSIFAKEPTEERDFQLHDEKDMSEAAAIGQLGGINSPATSINNGEPGDNFPKPSTASGGKEIASSQSVGVNPEAVESLDKVIIEEDIGKLMHQENEEDSPQETTELQGTISGNRTRTYWQPPMDRYFIELMLDQIQKGHQVDGLFRKEAWMEMIALFNAKFGFKYDVEILKNRYKTMRRQYNAIQNLLELDGFVWDETRQMVTADDFVWQDYVKTHADARQYMTRPITYYKDLLVICKDLSINGKDSFSGPNLEDNNTPNVKLGGAFKSSQSLAASASNEDQVGAVQELYDINLEHCLLDRQSKRSLEIPSISAHPNKASRKDESMVNAIREMAAVVSSLADKKADIDSSSSVSIELVIEAVQALPDMDEDLMLDACDFLEDEKKAKTFLALDFKLRKKWLMRKLRPNNL